MDTLAQLLVILFCLSALYAILGCIGTAAEGLATLAASRTRRAMPSTQRRPRRSRLRRRIDRDEIGVLRRPGPPASPPLRALRAR
jgi:hypothetical protein